MGREAGLDWRKQLNVEKERRRFGAGDRGTGDGDGGWPSDDGNNGAAGSM